MFYLHYDNGTGYFDCASSHGTLEEAQQAASDGLQTRQHITDDTAVKNMVWANYTPEQGKFADLVHFIKNASLGWDVSGPPPPLYGELKSAAGGDFGPLLKLCQQGST